MLSGSDLEGMGISRLSVTLLVDWEPLFIFSWLYFRSRFRNTCQTPLCATVSQWQKHVLAINNKSCHGDQWREHVVPMDRAIHCSICDCEDLKLPLTLNADCYLFTQLRLQKQEGWASIHASGSRP